MSTYAHEGHDLIEMADDPTFCATCGFDVMPPNACATKGGSVLMSDVSTTDLIAEIMSKHRHYAPDDDCGVSDSCHCGFDLITDDNDNNGPLIMDEHDKHVAQVVADALEAVTVPSEDGWEALNAAIHETVILWEDHGGNIEYMLREGLAGFRLINLAVPTESQLAELIWNTSRADEGTISSAGSNIIARAILARFRLPVPIEPEWGLSDSMLDTFPEPHFTSREANVRRQQRKGHTAIKVVRREVTPWLPVEPVQVDPSEVLDNE